MNKFVMSAVVMLLLMACETAPVRRENHIAEHPEWDTKMVKLINAGMIVRGMSKKQVRAAWGRHCYTCPGTQSSLWGESLEFRTQVVFFDPDGFVTRWEHK